MKTLNMFVVVDAATHLESFQKVVESMSGLSAKYETDIEAAINIITQQNFDLLVTDKNLPEDQTKKLHRLTDLLHPDAALIDFVMTDEDFIRYKLNGLIAKWIDAHSDGKVNFIDDPEL